MTVFILGGSNSRSSTGWTSYFAPSGHGPVVNMSIGATSSMMGAVNGLFTIDARPGDTVVLEYTLNDLGHLRRGYSAPDLLRHVEYLLRHCARRKVAVVPLVILPRWAENRAEPHRYVRQVTEMFAAHGLQPIDVGAAYGAHLGTGRIPADLYDGALHYHETRELMTFIAGKVAEVLPGQVPGGRFRAVAGHDLVLLRDFCQDRFTNSIIDLPAQSPPIRSGPLGVTGRVVGLLALTHTLGGVARLSIAGTSLEISLTHPREAFEKHLLKIINLPRLLQAPLRIGPGDALQIDWTTAPVAIAAEVGLRDTVGTRALRQHLGLVCGLVVETDDASADATRSGATAQQV